jgi:hypothetical protein
VRVRVSPLLPCQVGRAAIAPDCKSEAPSALREFESLTWHHCGVVQWKNDGLISRAARVRFSPPQRRPGVCQWIRRPRLGRGGCAFDSRRRTNLFGRSQGGTATGFDPVRTWFDSKLPSHVHVKLNWISGGFLIRWKSVRSRSHAPTRRRSQVGRRGAANTLRSVFDSRRRLIRRRSSFGRGLVS